MDSKDMELKRLQEENKQLKEQTIPEVCLKAAEIGILTYLAICNEETPRYVGNVMHFSTPINKEMLKYALRICAKMDMLEADIEFDALPEEEM